jgi:hypothetical protein
LGGHLVRKTIKPERPYIPRLMGLGEVAYALLDHHLSPYQRVTPNVYAAAPDVIYRSYLAGETGDLWRAELHRETGAIPSADSLIERHLERAWSAERIALLDMITLYQDRSARNWLKAPDQFWALDNGILWPWQGRHVDKQAIQTGSVEHLQPPIREVLVHETHRFEFKSGVFSTVWAGRELTGELHQRLGNLDWAAYFDQLASLICEPLGYPLEIVRDWRLLSLKRRAEWLYQHGRLPTRTEIFKLAWQPMIEPGAGDPEYWRPAWEM